jgi:hypothetical protein
MKAGLPAYLIRALATLDSQTSAPSPSWSSFFSIVIKKAPALSILITSENQIVIAR